MGHKTGMVNIQELAKEAAVEALKLQKEEERQRIRRNKFHNTELLLKNYLSLVEHYEKSKDKATDIFTAEELKEWDIDNINDVVIEAIRKSRIKTIIMISQVDAFLEVLKAKMVAKGQGERYRVIERLYLSPDLQHLEWGERIRFVAAELSCSVESVRRWKNDMIDELAPLLFGTNGLKLEL